MAPCPPILRPLANLNVLADKVPSQEVVLGVEPDFIYGGWESNFAGDTAGERPTLAQLGIATYVAPAACRSVKPPKPDLRRRLRRDRRDRRDLRRR
jgi:iron complex transport system substrate-binding protein